MAKVRVNDKTPLDRLRLWLNQNGIVRSRDLAALGIGREYLRVMVARGELLRLSRGIYASPDFSLSEHSSMALVARRIPRGVICLLSALAFHEMGTSLPTQVWVAVGVKANAPQLDYPKLHLVRYSALALRLEVETHIIDGVEVHITSPARTVVDCFRFRSKIGIDVALEALREGLRSRVDSSGTRLPPLCTRSEIIDLADKLRIATVIRPYLEAYSAS